MLRSVFKLRTTGPGIMILPPKTLLVVAALEGPGAQEASRFRGYHPRALRVDRPPAPIGRERAPERKEATL